MSKPRVIKDYERINEDLVAQIKLNYPTGFEKHLVTFKAIDGKFISALPFETEDRYYLIRMTRAEAKEIIEEDDDYDNDGLLKAEAQDEYKGEFEEIDAIKMAEEEPGDS